MEVPPAVSAKVASCAARLVGLTISAAASDAPSGIVLALGGSLDGNNCREFRDVAEAVLVETGAGGALILDLRSLTYISSTGVGAFAMLLAEARRRESALLIRGMREGVRAVFDVLGFSAFFTFIEAGA
jgi:anti-sigma B factor antagonist